MSAAPPKADLIGGLSRVGFVQKHMLSTPRKCPPMSGIDSYAPAANPPHSPLLTAASAAATMALKRGSSRIESRSGTTLIQRNPSGSLVRVRLRVSSKCAAWYGRLHHCASKVVVRLKLSGLTTARALPIPRPVDFPRVPRRDAETRCCGGVGSVDDNFFDAIKRAMRGDFGTCLVAFAVYT